MPTMMNNPQARERLATLWSMRETLGLVEVLEQINVLLEQGHITAEDLMFVKESAASLEKAASSAASRSEDVGEALIAYRRQRAQRRKEESNAAALKEQTTKRMQRYTDWSPAAIFGADRSQSVGSTLHDSNQHDHDDNDAQKVKENAISNYAAEVFQRCWRKAKLRHDIKAILCQRPYSRFRGAILAVQHAFRNFHRRRRFRAALVIQQQYHAWKLRRRHCAFVHGMYLFVRQWRARKGNALRLTSVRTIQRAGRVHIARRRRELVVQKRARDVLTIQRLARRRANEHRAQRTKAATLLQAQVRGQHSRRLFRTRQNAAVIVQFWVRRVWQRQTRHYNRAAAAVQRWFRVQLLRTVRQHLRERSVSKLQSWYRCCSLRYRNKLLGALLSKRAALTITRFVRFVAARRVRASLVLQGWTRAVQLRREARRKSLARQSERRARELALQEASRHASAVNIQAAVRRRIATLYVRKLTRAVAILHRAFATMRSRRSLRKLATATYAKVENDDLSVVVRPEPQQTKAPFYCSVFLKHGECSKGDACMFTHVAPHPPAQATASSPAKHGGPRQSGAGRLYGGTNSRIGTTLATTPVSDHNTLVEVPQASHHRPLGPAVYSRVTEWRGIPAAPDATRSTVSTKATPPHTKLDLRDQRIEHHHAMVEQRDGGGPTTTSDFTRDQYSQLHSIQQKHLVPQEPRRQQQQPQNQPSTRQAADVHQHRHRRRRKPRMAYTHLNKLNRTMMTQAKSPALSQRVGAAAGKRQHLSSTQHQQHRPDVRGIRSRNNSNNKNPHHTRRHLTTMAGNNNGAGAEDGSRYLSFRRIQNNYERSDLVGQDHDVRLPRLLPHVPQRAYR